MLSRVQGMLVTNKALPIWGGFFVFGMLISYVEVVPNLSSIYCSIPMSLGVNVIYGTEVSKELTPLWIFGPLFVALHVKALQGICALYIFSFKGTVNVVKQLPRVYKYIAGGKLKEDIRARVFRPGGNFENLDYKQVSAGMIKTLGDWLREACLDFVESIWPHYCKLVRMLKKANLA